MAWIVADKAVDAVAPATDVTTLGRLTPEVTESSLQAGYKMVTEVGLLWSYEIDTKFVPDACAPSFPLACA